MHSNEIRLATTQKQKLKIDLESLRGKKTMFKLKTQYQQK